ncbi:TfuA-like protein [Streptomyces cadmiisoli]|uniref:TfuA-like core domain-containing protein n=1 Tax=Streptomyces cadmiisoli TaxID=2184053 RepID=A0A2Z4JEL8_9ACTN|nr:hypothetical protein DN051_44410 [Streptomyces cadmiisoli]
MTTTVFTGPSISPNEVHSVLPQARVLPPAKRGDIYKARETGSTRILLIDGSFSHVLPVSPREVVDVATDGAQVLGSSSMGAVRAAECWPAGVQGVGAVYRMYRLGLFDSDDGVAVATNPEDGHRAVSVALVNIHAAVRKLYGLNLITRSQAVDLYGTAAGMYYPDRIWRLILKRSGLVDPDGSLEAICVGTDIKKHDALRALKYLASTADGGIVHNKARPFVAGPRYLPHDPLLGYDREQITPALARFVFGSGRFKKYLPLLLNSESKPPIEGRSRLAHSLPGDSSIGSALAEILADHREASLRLIGIMEKFAQFSTEVMLWHAMTQLRDHKIRTGVVVTFHHETEVRENIANSHGYRRWDLLRQDLRDGILPNGIPFSWIDEARADLTFSRA